MYQCVGRFFLFHIENTLGNKHISYFSENMSCRKCNRTNICIYMDRWHNNLALQSDLKVNLKTCDLSGWAYAFSVTCCNATCTPAERASDRAHCYGSQSIQAYEHVIAYKWITFKTFRLLKYCLKVCKLRVKRSDYKTMAYISNEGRYNYIFSSNM